MNQTIVIIPTYNESENISTLLDKLSVLDVDVLIVDDSSPDNTAEVVKKSNLYNSKVFLICRKEKLGLGSAYRDGFNWALSKKYKHIVEMDADFSHTINDLSNLLKNKDKNDVVIGSRYVEGGSVKGWSWYRHALSFLANKYSKFVTYCNVNDMTSGFRVYSDHALESIDFRNTKSNGYAFQIEMTVLCEMKKLQIKEVPITFYERRVGKSKMSSSIVLEAFPKVLIFGLKRIRNYLTTP